MLKEDLILEKISEIAKKCLYISTLETRKSDSLDFYDVPVWGIKEALFRAFHLGRTHTVTFQDDSNLEGFRAKGCHTPHARPLR